MSDDSLYRIVYLSRSTGTLDAERAAALGNASATKNLEVGVTGLLLYDGARFLQAIEGGRDATIATMDRIVLDSRHDSISYLHDGPITEREFGDWGMHFKFAPAGCCSTDFLERVKHDMAIVEDPHLQAAFIGFAVLSSHRPRGYVCSQDFAA